MIRKRLAHRRLRRRLDRLRLDIAATVIDTRCSTQPTIGFVDVRRTGIAGRLGVTDRRASLQPCAEEQQLRGRDALALVASSHELVQQQLELTVAGYQLFED